MLEVVAVQDWINREADPMNVFAQWYELALKTNSFEPTQVTLATVDNEGMPAARLVLLKGYDDKGFSFFTNYKSHKAKDLEANKKAALVFHWQNPHHRQIRIRGMVERLTHQESNDYFRTRPRGSQIGAWASPQSQEIRDHQQLIEKVANLEKRFADQTEIPCPEFWGGYRVVPLSIEFWEAGEFRLHKRIRFYRDGTLASWQAQYLAP
jgi:pyridoxamine 5'-phosphate oxidase